RTGPARRRRWRSWKGTGCATAARCASSAWIRAGAGRAWRARIGLVLQGASDLAELTVVESVRHFAGYYPRPPPAAAPSLSAREIEVLRRVGRGLSNAEIGRELFISEATAKTHLLRIFHKLGVSDRTAAVTTAMARGLL